MDTRKKMLGSRLLAGLLSLVLVVGMLPAASADSYQDGYIKGDLICSITDDTSEGEILICKKEEGHTHGKECYEDTDTDQKIQPVVKKKTIFIVIINLIVITHTPMIVGTGSPLSLR